MNTFCKRCPHYQVCLHWIYVFKQTTPEKFVDWCLFNEKMRDKGETKHEG